jgi:hypothetical protein
MKRSVFGALMTLIVAFSIVVPVVQAQQTILRANVPFAFNIGDKQLPAGTYVVREMDRGTLIQSKDGVNSVLGIYNYAEPSKDNATKLVFHRVGDHYFLAEICTSARGQGLSVPQSRLEKEFRASNSGPRGVGPETVIVALR